MSGNYDFSIRINNFMQCQCLQAVAQECADVIITSTAEELFALRNALQLK